MEKLLELVGASTELDLKIKDNAKGIASINQTVRNGLKSDITNALVSDLSTQLGETATVGRTRDGVAVELEIGGEMLVFTIDPVIKPLDYDFEYETADFAEIVAEREQKEQERLAKKNKKK